MPELPEVETTVNGIKPHLLERIIKEVKIHNNKCRLVPDAKVSNQIGQKIKSVFRRAKYICLELDSGFIVIHLGMSGNLKVVNKDIPLLKHDHVEIILDNDQDLRYNDHRRFGGVVFISKEEFQDNGLFAHNGPDALSDDFNAKYLLSYQQKKVQRPIKQLLMDNAVVVGVGNIYANESLFACGINPCTYIQDLHNEQISILVDYIKELLLRSIAAGGTTLRDFEQPDGKPGYFVQQLQVYGKENEYLVDYDDYIARITLGGRSSFFCLTKQPLIGKAKTKYEIMVNDAVGKARASIKYK